MNPRNMGMPSKQLLNKMSRGRYQEKEGPFIEAIVSKPFKALKHGSYIPRLRKGIRKNG